MKLTKSLICSTLITLTAFGCNSGSNSNTTNNSATNNLKITQTNTSPQIIGYYTNWSTYGANYQPSNIPNQVDTIIYAFAQVGDCAANSNATEQNPQICNKYVNNTGTILQTGRQDWQLHTTDAWSDFNTYNNSQGINIGGLGNIANTLATGKNVLLSIGGWTLTAPIGTAINDQNRTAFVQSIISFMKLAEADAFSKGIKNHFAGVDIDWEPNSNQWTLAPASSNNRQLTKIDLTNYYNFLSQLKQALSQNGYNNLSIAMTANPNAINNADQTYGGGYWKSIAALGVQLDMMTYDYNGQNFAGICKYTQFNAPLIPDASNPCQATGNFNISDSYNTLNNIGVPAKQIGIGIPAYGRAYSITNTTSVESTNPYILFAGSESSTSMNNFMVTAFGPVWTNRNILTGRAYGAATTSENTNWQNIADYSNMGQTVATAYINYSTPAFISYSSYNDAQTIMLFAQNNGLASVMVWALDQDVQPGDTFTSGNSINWDSTSIISGLASKQ